ncbi:hypothetical protein HLB23_22090 [Nocardia uniformis]|uniref:Uncharacterized protein n=1 Tax=Nocardia uniformis TaxID=53432 RepID=A0A849C8A2_9NOCA|nr:hypothetical protein [Nocardia uniformis]NNH72515.1 hypothetical protein [Nocardia uniformis]
MRTPTRQPTIIEWSALVVAVIIGFGVATYFGNLIAGIAVMIAIAIIGSGFFYVRK